MWLGDLGTAVGDGRETLERENRQGDRGYESGYSERGAGFRGRGEMKAA